MVADWKFMNPRKALFVTTWTMDFFNVYGTVSYKDAKLFLTKMGESFQEMYFQKDGKEKYERIRKIWIDFKFDQIDVILYREISDSIIEMKMSDYPKVDRSIRRFFPGWERVEKDSITQ